MLVLLKVFSISFKIISEHCYFYNSAASSGASIVLGGKVQKFLSLKKIDSKYLETVIRRNAGCKRGQKHFIDTSIRRRFFNNNVGGHVTENVKTYLIEIAPFWTGT